MDFRVITAAQREALYKEVWSEPVTTVAKRYGLSDNGLRKHCVKLGIPLPPAGYWARVRAGRQVPRPALPKVTGEIRHHVRRYFIKYKTDIERLTEAELAADVEFGLFSQETKELIEGICSQLRVKAQLRNPHHLITEHEKGALDRKKKQKEPKLSSFRSSYSAVGNSAYQDSKPILPINVSGSNLNRAYRILDAIITTLEDMEGHTTVSSEGGKDQACFVIEHSFFNFQVREVSVHGEHSKDDNESRPRLVLSMSATSWFTRDQQAKMDYKDNGGRPLETQVGKIIRDMFVIANKQRATDELKDRERKKVWAEQERQLHLEQMRKGELQEVRLLEQAASDWSKAESIRRFTDHLERRIHELPDSEKKNKLLAWSRWARGKADWLDPLTAKEDELLGWNKNLFELIEADQTKLRVLPTAEQQSPRIVSV